MNEALLLCSHKNCTSGEFSHYYGSVTDQEKDVSFFRRDRLTSSAAARLILSKNDTSFSWSVTDPLDLYKSFHITANLGSYFIQQHQGRFSEWFHLSIWHYFQRYSNRQILLHICMIFLQGCSSEIYRNICKFGWFLSKLSSISVLLRQYKAHSKTLSKLCRISRIGWSVCQGAENGILRN